MRVVIALGGKANARAAAKAVAEIANDHEVVLGAQSEGMIGYLTIERELANLLPPGRPLASILTMVEIDPRDPAFAPKRIFEIRPIKWLLERDTVVIAADGGGVLTAYGPRGRSASDVECVIDKDRAAELLARELDADLFVMATAADAVYVNWGRPSQAAIRRASPASLGAWTFAANSMGRKVDAACRFATTTGRKAAIGAIESLWKIVSGDAGTTISADEAGITFVGVHGVVKQ